MSARLLAALRRVLREWWRGWRLASSVEVQLKSTGAPACGVLPVLPNRHQGRRSVG